MTTGTLTPSQRYVLHRLAERQGRDGEPVCMSGTPRRGDADTMWTPTKTLLALERRGLAQAVRTGRHIAAWRWGLTEDGWREVERGPACDRDDLRGGIGWTSNRERTIAPS